MGMMTGWLLVMTKVLCFVLSSSSRSKVDVDYWWS